MKNLNKLSCSAAAVLLASCVALPVMANMTDGFSAGVGVQTGASLLDGKYTDGTTSTNVSKAKVGDLTVLPELNVAYRFGKGSPMSVHFNIIPLKGKVEGTSNGSGGGAKYKAEVEFPMALTVRAAHKLNDGGSVFLGLGAVRAKFKHSGNTDVTFASKSKHGFVVELGTANGVSATTSMDTIIGFSKYGKLKGTKTSNREGGAANNWEARPMQIYGKLVFNFSF